MVVLGGGVFQTLQVQAYLDPTTLAVMGAMGQLTFSFAHPDHFRTLRMTLNLNTS